MRFGPQGWQVWCRDVRFGTAAAEATEYYSMSRPRSPYRFRRHTVYLNNVPGTQCIHHLTYQGKRVYGGDDKLI